MPNFKQLEDELLVAYSERLIDTTEFVLLYDRYRSRQRQLPYKSYDRFDLDRLSDEECLLQLRFFKGDIYDLAEALEVFLKLSQSFAIETWSR